jgi:SRSO17 transposase
MSKKRPPKKRNRRSSTWLLGEGKPYLNEKSADQKNYFAAVEQQNNRRVALWGKTPLRNRPADAQGRWRARGQNLPRKKLPASEPEKSWRPTKCQKQAPRNRTAKGEAKPRNKTSSAHSKRIGEGHRRSSRPKKSTAFEIGEVPAARAVEEETLH